jgi:hypothetical protein
VDSRLVVAHDVDRVARKKCSRFFEEAPGQMSCESLRREREVRVKVPSGFCVRWWHDADRAARVGKFQGFRGGVGAEKLRKSGLEK